MNYELAYKVGFHPWEDAIEDPEFVETITDLFEREERGRDPPYGRALDVGTGSGIWGIELAKRGWQVTGIDTVERVLRRARNRVEDADVEMELVLGDVTELETAGIDDEYQLVLDTGTFHGLNRAQREAMAREVDAVAGPDATVLLLVWDPKRRGPLPRGATRDEIEAAFPGWTVTDMGPSQFTAPKPVELLLTPNEHWYRLRRE
ncbi:Methyltransferase type 11 (plasmid) [Haloterrigena turkmenica DSM 5511]|uniref:Methyltransferase type 11 n=1 Tax=Haloterrigena turkmenica (strain ATCC 51198 / DSM 5511 / JCM 9101 / NCIMB 13204 / VKM B-1734 / 4k) TaxID=543526 RepID=D2S0E8_HALTV|nr:class I SAM-dependent methyltransferase [Haloterrigena turkmenica]ADB62845.1 Methyltransferase type 11 [Haloterrigena turkmenica DSM 5511]